MYNKIFGVGLGRTGTSSLTIALRELGYNIFHQAKISFLPELKELIDINDGGTDAPVAYAYKELDKMYPNSKWILTTRRIEQWLKSIEWIMSWVKTSENDLKLRALLYGDRKFNREKFIKAYRKHHRETLEYFKDRDDFLIMDIEKSDFNWKKLCTFLEKPIPDIPFPHEFKRRIK